MLHMSLSTAYAGLDLCAVGEYKWKKWIKSAKEMCIAISGKQQWKKCSLPYLDNISKRNVHCHIWRMSVKEMCIATPGEYQQKNCALLYVWNTSKRNVHCHIPVLFSNRFHSLIHSVNITYMNSNKTFDA